MTVRNNAILDMEVKVHLDIYPLISNWQSVSVSDIIFPQFGGDACKY